MTLGYKGNFAYYGSNDDNDWKTNMGTFGLDYKAPGGLILGISDFYSDAEDPYGSDNEYKLGTPKTERWSNDLKNKIGYDFGNRVRVFSYFNLYKLDYEREGDFSQDYDEKEYGVGVQARLRPKTWGFIRYHYGERDYSSHPLMVNGVATNSREDNDADYDWHRANMGLTWDPGAKLKGELNFGYQWRDQDNQLDAAGVRYENEDTWIASTSVTYKATATTSLSLNINRALRTIGSTSTEFYEDTGIGLDLKKMLLAKLRLTAGATYRDHKYNLPVPRNREDDNYDADIGLGYQIQKWLNASVGYRYMKKDSNIEANDFTDNQFMISLSGVY
ncbi:MAG: outer membrane beta-barrel protein [Deltaproteobacteria bacterium]|nr:outer membrane beta-barrel protein [Deltaproteobacteria bacterium]